MTKRKVAPVDSGRFQPDLGQHLLDHGRERLEQAHHELASALVGDRAVLSDGGASSSSASAILRL
jgi:hypothetical protein